MFHVVAISNQKGGVAKTTTCISLGACLAGLGKKVLLIDLDPQANLSLSLGIHDDVVEETISDVLETALNPRKLNWAEIIKPTSLEGLFVIPSDARLWTIERMISEKAGYEVELTKILARWKNDFDYVLFDCSPSLGPLTIMALTAAERVLIPIQTEFLAAVGLVRLIDTVEAVKEHTNPSLDFSLLAVMYDQRNSICRDVLQKLKENFPQKIIKTIIGVDTRLKECVASGQPITQYDPKTRASLQYAQLAGEIEIIVGKSKEKA
jgi:chromosome partitioning protein